MDLRKKLWKPLQHLPLLQPLVQIGIYFELEWIYQDIEAIDKDYKNVTLRVVKQYDAENNEKTSEKLENIETAEIKREEEIDISLVKKGKNELLFFKKNRHGRLFHKHTFFYSISLDCLEYTKSLKSHTPQFLFPKNQK